MLRKQSFPSLQLLENSLARAGCSALTAISCGGSQTLLAMPPGARPTAWTMPSWAWDARQKDRVQGQRQACKVAAVKGKVGQCQELGQLGQLAVGIGRMDRCRPNMWQGKGRASWRMVPLCLSWALRLGGIVLVITSQHYSRGIHRSRPRGRLGDGLRDCGEVPGVGQAWGTQLPYVSLTAHMPALSRHVTKLGSKALGPQGGSRTLVLASGHQIPPRPAGNPELWCRDRAQSCPLGLARPKGAGQTHIVL